MLSNRVLKHIIVSSDEGKPVRLVILFVSIIGYVFPQSRKVREVKYLIPVKSFIPLFSTDILFNVSTAVFVVSIWLPLIAAGITPSR